MIPREYLITITALTSLLIVGAHSENVKTYDTSEWIPITDKSPLQENSKDHNREKKATARVLHLTPDLTTFNGYLPQVPKRLYRRQNLQYQQETPPPSTQQQIFRQSQLNRGEFLNQQYFQQPQVLDAPQYQYFASNPLNFQDPNLLTQGITGPFNSPTIQEINQGLVGGFRQMPMVLPQEQNKDTVQLVYVPLETLNQKQVQNQGDLLNTQQEQGNVAQESDLSELEQSRFKSLHELQLEKQRQQQKLRMSLEDQQMLTRREEERLKSLREQQKLKQAEKQKISVQPYHLITTLSPLQHKQQQLQSIQSDFAQQALSAFKLQQELFQSENTAPSTTTQPTRSIESTTKRKAHQPPLAVYMIGSNDVKVSDVLSLLKNAKTISVQDSAGANGPQVFVGPNSLEAPEGYVKFDLPYLSSLDHNRIERKLEKLPFFVAPLSYSAPAGYSKIPLPAPHVGSVVVSHKEEVQESRPHFAVQNALPTNIEEKAPPPFRPNVVHSFILEDAVTQPPFSVPTTTRPNPLRQTINHYELQQINNQFVSTPKYSLQDDYDEDVKRPSIVTTTTPSSATKPPSTPTLAQRNFEKQQYTPLEEFSLHPSRNTASLQDESVKSVIPLSTTTSTSQNRQSSRRKPQRQRVPSYYQLNSEESLSTSIPKQEERTPFRGTATTLPVLDNSAETTRGKIDYSQEHIKESGTTTTVDSSKENNFKVPSQLPSVNSGIHSLINDLEDPSIRSLLSPASIVPTTERDSYLPQQNYKKEPLYRQQYNDQSQFIQTPIHNTRSKPQRVQLDDLTNDYNQPSKSYEKDILENYDQTQFIQKTETNRQPQIEDQSKEYEYSESPKNSFNKDVKQNLDQPSVPITYSPHTQTNKQNFDQPSVPITYTTHTQTSKTPLRIKPTQYQEETIQYKEQPEIFQVKTSDDSERPTHQTETDYQQQFGIHQENSAQYNDFKALNNNGRFVEKPESNKYSDLPVLNNIKNPEYEKLSTRLQEPNDIYKGQPQQYLDQTNVFSQSSVPLEPHDIQPTVHAETDTQDYHAPDIDDSHVFNSQHESTADDIISTRQTTTTTTTEATTTTRRQRNRTRGRFSYTSTQSPPRRTRRPTVRTSATEYTASTEAVKSPTHRLRSRTRPHPVVQELTERTSSSISIEQTRPQSYMQFEQPRLEEQSTIARNYQKLYSSTEAISSTTKQLPNVNVDVVINHPVTSQAVEKEPEITSDTKAGEPYTRTNEIVTQAPPRIRSRQRVRPKTTTTTSKPKPDDTPQEEFYGFLRTPSFSRSQESKHNNAEFTSTSTTERARFRTITKPGITSSTRTRYRGSSHFKPQTNIKTHSEDDGLEGENYPASFIKAKTERPKFQITIDSSSNYGYDEDDQQSHSTINQPKIIKNDLPIDRKIVESQEQESFVKTEPDLLKTAVTAEDDDNLKTSTTTTVKPRGRRRGGWKLVKRPPVDSFDTAESQYIGNIAANSFLTEKSKDDKLPTQPSAAAGVTSKTSTESNFFDSIYKMFGLTSEQLRGTQKDIKEFEQKQSAQTEESETPFTLALQTTTPSYNSNANEEKVKKFEKSKNIETQGAVNDRTEKLSTIELSDTNNSKNLEEDRFLGPEEISLTDYKPIKHSIEIKDESSVVKDDTMGHHSELTMSYLSPTDFTDLVTQTEVSHAENSSNNKLLGGIKTINNPNNGSEYSVDTTTENNEANVTEHPLLAIDESFEPNDNSQTLNFDSTGLQISGNGISSYGPLSQVELAIENVSTDGPDIVNDEIVTENIFIATTNPTEQISKKNKTKTPIEMWDLGKVITSTSTEVSHETEICYRGRCVKSPGLHNSSSP